MPQGYRDENTPEAMVEATLLRYHNFTEYGRNVKERSFRARRACDRGGEKLLHLAWFQDPLSRLRGNYD